MWLFTIAFCSKHQEHHLPSYETNRIEQCFCSNLQEVLENFPVTEDRLINVRITETKINNTYSGILCQVPPLFRGVLHCVVQMGSWTISAAVEVIIALLDLLAAIGSRLTQTFFISIQITATASIGFYDRRLNTKEYQGGSEKRTRPARL